MTYSGVLEKFTSLVLFRNESINILLLVCLIYFIAGYVVVRQIKIKDDIFERFKFLISPLIGFSVLALFFNVFIILGFEMKSLTIPALIWLVFSLVVMAYDRLKFVTFRLTLVTVVAFFVLLFSSIGLFNVGKNYLGYGWVDSLNYISTAEIFKEYPLNVSRDKLVDKVQYLPAIDVKDDRIAQSLMLVFFSQITGESTKTVFGPVLVSSVFLYFLAVFLLTNLLFKSFYKSIFVALNIGISSSFAMVHVETFFSHASAIPFVILYTYLINVFRKSNDLYCGLFLGLIFSTLFFLYPELVPVLLILSLPYLFNYLNKKQYKFTLAFIITNFVLFWVNKAVILNIIFNRVGAKLTVLDPIYNFSGTIFMFNRIMFGHIDTWGIRSIVSIILVILSVVNVVFIIKNKEKERYGVLVAIFFLIALTPLMFSYKYNYFKLFLTFSPFIILSFYLLVNRFTNKYLFVITLIVCLFFAAKGTRHIIRYTYLPGERSQIGGLYYGEDQVLNQKLEKMSGQKLLINGRNSMETAWLAYYGRNNDVKVVSNEFAMRDISASAPKLIFSDYQNIDKYQIISTQKFPEVISRENIKVYPYFVNNQGLEGTYPNQFSWVGKQAEFGFLYQDIEPVIGNVYMKLDKGSFSDFNYRKFEIVSDSKVVNKGNFGENEYMFDFPVDLVKGKISFFIKTLLENSIRSSSSDTREFNLLLSDLKLFVCDGSFEKLYFVLPESDGWVTSDGFKVLGCMNRNNDIINIDFSQIVSLKNNYDFSVNGNINKGIRDDKTIKIEGVKRFVKDNYISIDIIPKFFDRIGNDSRKLSFFPINYSRN